MKHHGSLNFGLEAHNRVSIYFGNTRAATLDKLEDGRWRMREPLRDFDSTDAAAAWLGAPAAQQLDLFGKVAA